MREADFLDRLQALAVGKVDGLDGPAKAAILTAVAASVRDGAPGTCTVVPFTPGCRPTDEASHPGLGSSDAAALILGEEDPDNRVYVLYTVERARPGDVVEVTLRTGGGPINGWDRRSVPAQMFTRGGDGRPALARVNLAHAGGQRLVIAFDPVRDLLDGDGYGLGELFAREVDVELRLRRGDVAIAGGHLRLLCADGRGFGSLYARIAEQLVAPDMAAQARRAGRDNPGVAHHPWYPVLRIGMDKADLYMRGVAADIVGKQRFLPDPGWLLRVGLYLELLTGIGIVEAVRAEAGDLLAPEEREVYETSPRFAEIRERINPAGWRECWSLREAVFGSATRNLLRKRTATLAFLHVHHEDLRHAMELAGPNHVDAQETWQRVFRDAERAVMRQTEEAFPELASLPGPAREFVLWHRQGEFGSRLRIPGAVTRLFADQDGLYTSACRQYRASMNEVAEWAKERALTDHTGPECIPVTASLLEAHVSGSARVGALQARDGYREPLVIGSEAPPPVTLSHGEVLELIADAPVFRALSRHELTVLLASSRCLELGPGERFVVQGQEGTSLFVVVDGAVEVLVRGDDGADRPVATMERGAIVGEMSLLSGEPRAATVRSLEGATVYEIGRLQYEPILRARPELAEALAAEAAARRQTV